MAKGHVSLRHLTRVQTSPSLPAGHYERPHAGRCQRFGIMRAAEETLGFGYLVPVLGLGVFVLASVVGTFQLAQQLEALRLIWSALLM